MLKVSKSSVQIKNQYRAYLFLVVMVLGMTLILSWAGDAYFNRFLDEMNPLVVLILSGFLGFLFLSFLLSQGFSIYKPANFTKAFRYAWWVIVFPLVAILVDCIIFFPKDTNILFPTSLLFYPVMAFLVEIIFHIMPFVILYYFFTTLFKTVSKHKIIWICILVIAILEPTFQVLFMKTDPIWAKILVWLNLFLFNATQLVVFKKFDFVSMYALRIFYYLIWHIIWGYFRLELFF